MGDNKISAAVVRLACDAYDKVAQWGDVTNEFEAMNAALEAALPHLQGEVVPVAWIDLSKLSRSKMVCASAYQIDPSQVPVFNHPQPAELSEVSGGSGELGERQSAWNDSARLACLESWAREPGGLLLHAESGTGRRGLGLGENCGRRTLAQAIDGCATHAEKDSFAALAATGKQQDGCTESNCRRCLTHPDHRGDMPHAGIGSTGKQQVGEEVEDDRFPGGFADAIAYVNELEELAETLHAKVFGHESDGESGASTLLQMTIHQLDEKSEQVGEVQASDFDIDDVRELFEKHAKGRDLTPDTWGVSSYVDPYVDNDWNEWVAAWKAIASLQPVGAQGIDLGQLKVEVQRLRKRTDPVLGEKAMYVRLDAVLALIDGRDAGTGVGRG